MILIRLLQVQLSLFGSFNVLRTCDICISHVSLASYLPVSHLSGDELLQGLLSHTFQGGCRLSHLHMDRYFHKLQCNSYADAYHTCIVLPMHTNEDFWDHSVQCTVHVWHGHWRHSCVQSVLSQILHKVLAATSVASRVLSSSQPCAVCLVLGRCTVMTIRGTSGCQS